MIELFYAPTPNGHKISIALEEMGLPYKVTPVNILRGEQMKPEFLAVSPNNKIPAIVDHDPAGGGAPISMFESGAILVYLAGKSGHFLPADMRQRYVMLEWLMWEMSGQGPTAGQANHFANYAQEKLPYAINRFVGEAARLYGVLDRHLAGQEFVAGEYSIADMAIWPWAHVHETHKQSLDDFPNVRRWHQQIGQRPAVQRGVAMLADMFPKALDDEARKILFGHHQQK